jgi:transposase
VARRHLGSLARRCPDHDVLRNRSSLVAQRLPIPRPPPEALHILDRFHIVAKMNTALDEVRAGESRRMANEGRTPLLKNSRRLLPEPESTHDFF